MLLAYQRYTKESGDVIAFEFHAMKLGRVLLACVAVSCGNCQAETYRSGPSDVGGRERACLLTFEFGSAPMQVGVDERIDIAIQYPVDVANLEVGP